MSYLLLYGESATRDELGKTGSLILLIVCITAVNSCVVWDTSVLGTAQIHSNKMMPGKFAVELIAKPLGQWVDRCHQLERQ